MTLLGAFAALALMLTVVGLYGVMAYSVSRGTREIGLRLALGAQRSSVLTMVLREAAILLVTGIGMGVVGSLASASVLKTMLYGTAPRNPLVDFMSSRSNWIYGDHLVVPPDRSAWE